MRIARVATTDSVGTVREVADAPRTIEGTAVPYGVVSGDTDVGREVFVPGAFRESVEKWTGRNDGARMAYRPKHGDDPVGVVTELRDTPEGVEVPGRDRGIARRRQVPRAGPQGPQRGQHRGRPVAELQAFPGRHRRPPRGTPVRHRRQRLAGLRRGAHRAPRHGGDDDEETETDARRSRSRSPTPREPEPSRRDAVANDPTVQAIVVRSPGYVTRPESGLRARYRQFVPP